MNKKHKPWNQTPEFNLSYLSPMRVADPMEELNLNSLGKISQQSIEKFDAQFIRAESGVGSQRSQKEIPADASGLQDNSLQTFFKNTLAKVGGNFSPGAKEIFPSLGSLDQDLGKSCPELKPAEKKVKKRNKAKVADANAREILKKREPDSAPQKESGEKLKKKLESEVGNTKKSKRKTVDKVSDLTSSLNPSDLPKANKKRKESYTSNLSNFDVENKRKGSTQTTPKIGATSNGKFLEPDCLPTSALIAKKSKKRIVKGDPAKANSTLGDTKVSPQSPTKLDKSLAKSSPLQIQKNLKFQSPGEKNLVNSEIVYPSMGNYGYISANDTPFKSIINHSIHSSDFDDDSSDPMESKKPEKIQPEPTKESKRESKKESKRQSKKNSVEILAVRKASLEAITGGGKKNSGVVKNGAVAKPDTKGSSGKKAPMDAVKADLNKKVKNKKAGKNLVKKVSDTSSYEDSSAEESPETHYDFDKRLLPHIAAPKSSDSSFSDSSEDVKNNKETSSNKPSSKKQPSYMKAKSKNSHKFSIITPKADSERSVPAKPEKPAPEPSKKPVVPKPKESTSEDSSEDSSVDSDAKNKTKAQPIEEKLVQKKKTSFNGKSKNIMSSGSDDSSDSDDDSDKKSSISKDKSKFKSIFFCIKKKLEFDKSKSIFNKNKNRIEQKFNKKGEKI